MLLEPLELLPSVFELPPSVFELLPSVFVVDGAGLSEEDVDEPDELEDFSASRAFLRDSEG